MSEQNNKHNEENKHTEPVVTDAVKEAAPEGADEIKAQIEGDLKEMNENESAKDWASELKAVEDKYLRLYAEFENYKRRTSAERLELFKTANQEVLVALLPVLDDFERALKSMQQATDIAAVKEGVDLVSNKLKNILQQKGLKAMESVGKSFDSDYHEAITKIPAPTDEMKDKVVDEVEKGYFLGDKVIRFAKVIVGE
jgi:molecular chaperone GrpE